MDITVVGTLPDPQERQRELTQFVRQMGVATSEQPAARWIEPVCPRVVGLADEYAARVEAAIRATASQTGAPLARGKCRGNLIVAFTADGDDLVGRIVAKSPGQFAQVPLPDRAALKHGDAPVRWWYHAQLRSRDGVRANAVPPPWTSGNSEAGNSVLPMDAETTTINQTASSVVSTQVMRGLSAATVVVDVNRAEGVSLDALAAYVALVGLAEIRPSDPAPRGSILQLFEPDALVGELTARDAAFLTALYKLPLDRRGRQHRGLLVNALLKAEAARP